MKVLGLPVLALDVAFTQFASCEFQSFGTENLNVELVVDEVLTAFNDKLVGAVQCCPGPPHSLLFLTTYATKELDHYPLCPASTLGLHKPLDDCFFCRILQELKKQISESQMKLDCERKTSLWPHERYHRRLTLECWLLGRA